MFFSTKVWPLVISDTRILTAATQTTYTRPTVSPLGARISASSGGTTYVKTTSGSIITVVPKSLATLGGKIISSNIVSGQSATHPGCVFNWSHFLWSVTLLSSANRHNDKDHHHPCDLQTQCHRGSENHRKGSDHSGAAWKERCHHAVKCRGQSATPLVFTMNKLNMKLIWTVCDISGWEGTAGCSGDQTCHHHGLQTHHKDDCYPAQRHDQWIPVHRYQDHPNQDRLWPAGQNAGETSYDIKTSRCSTKPQLPQSERSQWFEGADDEVQTLLRFICRRWPAANIDSDSNRIFMRHL